jgi:hypothetical protein
MQERLTGQVFLIVSEMATTEKSDNQRETTNNNDKRACDVTHSDVSFGWSSYKIIVTVACCPLGSIGR